jgi:hypothetical protein
MTDGQQLLATWRTLTAAQQERLAEQAINQLPPELKRILLLAEQDGLSDIAIGMRVFRTVAVVREKREEARRLVWEYLKAHIRQRDDDGGGANTPVPATPPQPPRPASDAKTFGIPVYEARD